MKAAIFVVLLVLGLGYLNSLITPDIYVEVIDGERYVVQIDDKEVFRPLTQTDEIEGNIIEVK